MKLYINKILIFLFFFFGPLLFCRVFDLGVDFYLGSPVNYESYAFDQIKNVQGELIIGPKYDFEWYKELFEGSDNIDLQLYSLTHKDALDFLSKKSRRGVKVRMILENNKYLDNTNKFDKLKKELEDAGIQVKTDEHMGTTYIHSKIFLLDHRFIIQSANLTYSSFFRNIEHFFVSNDSEILANLREIFEKDWNGERITKDEIHPNLLICNINCRSKIESIIDLAEQIVYIETMNIDDERLIEKINAKSDLDVRIILANTDNNLRIGNEFKDIDVRFIKSPFLHAKSILVDNKYLIVGSINLTTNSMDNNREVGILLLDESIIRQFKFQFEKDRENLE